MRSALLCVFFTLIIHKEIIHAQSDDFRPTPIPLNEWIPYNKREGRAGTLQETFKPDSTSAAAAIPAHYWEDALRHSVYLTLVRDKIDQLIAKGDVISPNSKPDSYDSKEIDDHDLWNKIKTAPFDRIKEDDPSAFGDVTIMAKGRLLEENGGFRFAEDERTKEKCSSENCMEGVKAFWSVKRVRQRDQETSPGKYHYELTFSVISQIPKKQRKPYENPIRTFTVKETSPNGIIEGPKEYRRVGYVPNHTARPERAVWVHKNIAPARSAFTGRKQYFSGLDRIFSSFFSDDDDKSYESPPTRYKQNSYPAQTGSQYSKIGHVGLTVDHHQTPFVFRPQPVQHVRPPLQAPPTNQIQTHQEMHTETNNYPYAHYIYDHRVEPSQNLKTTRPAVLPTPLPPIQPNRDQYAEVTNTMSVENTANNPDATNIHKTYNKYNKPTPAKVNYFSDHVRPPVYNAPPGVFVTMDKKPFKPMPPLKLIHSSKSHRTNKPIDFRPSQQILDHSSEQSLFADNSFRPITINYGDNKSSESGEIDYTVKKSENKNRKANVTDKKPSKKNENTKLHRHTTATPDIITIASSSEEESMDWTNVLGAFTKTTPMVAQTEKMQVMLETTTPMTTTKSTTTPKKRTTTTTEAVPGTTVSTTTTTTTAKPKKRTRPPPKFVKQDKIKKHKRITTPKTTTRPTTPAPENISKRRVPNDLMTQASSAPTGTMKTFKEHHNKTVSTTSTTTSTTTTTKPTSAMTTTTTTTTTTLSPSTQRSVGSSTQPKNKNRFRQSTLMYKGTSVKHDRWSAINMQKNHTTTPVPSAMLHRRKGSNFQGYVPSSTPRLINEERGREKSHADRKSSTLNSESSTKSPDMTSQTSPNYEETVDQYESNSVLPTERLHKGDKNYEDESKDHSEYIFQETTTPTSYKEEESSAQIKQSSYSAPKNRTKCKKRKSNSQTTEESTDIDYDFATTTVVSSTTSKLTSEVTASSIFENFFNLNFNSDDEDKYSTEKADSDLDEEESRNHDSYLKIDNDFEEFLGVLNGEKQHREGDDDHEQYGDDSENEDEDDDDDEEDDDEDDLSSLDDEFEESKIPSIDDDNDFESEENEDKKESARNSDNENQDKKRPYSFLELMAMS